MGATIGLYTSALDDRIAGTVSVCGFTPMRSNVEGRAAEGIYGPSYLHGLLPRLGIFIGEESRIPYDFDGILACIAPRPLLIISPTWDLYADIKDIRLCIDEVWKVYRLFKVKDNLEF